MRICTLALIVVEILTFDIFDVENLRQGHGEEKLDLRHSISCIRLHIGDFIAEFSQSGKLGKGTKFASA